MDFDLTQVDHLLSTTRAVRRKLDLDRPVPDDVLLRCVDLAEQAPSGSNQASRRWLVVRDPATKKQLAELFFTTFGPARHKRAELERDPAEVERVLKDGARRAREVAAPVMEAVRRAAGL